jgi:signal transduction histidine kinase
MPESANPLANSGRAGVGDTDWKLELRTQLEPAATALRQAAEQLANRANAVSDGYRADVDKMCTACGRLVMLLAEIQAAPATGNWGKLRHDLRTPINAIKGYGEILMEDASDAGHGDLATEFHRFLQQADAILGSIESLVVPSR